ncbi:MAG: AMP-binding protein, partial [Cyanobacteria bacterium P01_A01_bin.135]
MQLRLCFEDNVTKAVNPVVTNTNITDTNITDTNITGSIAHWAAQTPEQVALVAEEVTTYGALFTQVQQVAAWVAAFETQGRIQPRVALLTSSAAMLPVFLGTAFAGGLSLVLSPRWSLTQLRQVLTAHHSDLLLGEAGLIDALRDS